MGILIWAIIGIALFSLLLYLFYQWIINVVRFTEQVDGHGLVAIVTGANSEIGKELVKELVKRNVRVYLLCRSLKRGRETKCNLVKYYGCNPAQMVLMQADMCNSRSVREFVTKFRKVESRLDILVNNAGMVFRPFKLSGDGWELFWPLVRANYLGQFLLTELLRPALEASVAGGRVVNVSSLALGLTKFPPDFQFFKDLLHFVRFSEDTYARAQLVQVTHAMELAKRIRDKKPRSKVTINACHLGVIYADMQHDIPGWRLIKHPFHTYRFFHPFVWYVQKTARDGAQTPLFLALSKKIEGVSGKYFSDCVECSDDEFSLSPERCEQLYNNSLKACGLATNYCGKNKIPK